MKSSGKRALSFSIRLSIEYILPIHVSSGVTKSKMEGEMEKKNHWRVFKNLQFFNDEVFLIEFKSGSAAVENDMLSYET
jgi:hypothetical protein